MRSKRIIIFAISLLVFFGSLIQANAALNAVGPNDPANGFPVWYQDSNGLALRACLSQTQNANGFLCGLLADPGFNPGQPIIFPTNFPEELFWWTGESSMALTGGGDALLVLALEGAFAGGPVLADDQVSFARVRLRITTTLAGTYRITHPFGTAIFTNVGIGTRAINDTQDVGLGAPGVFTGALGGDIGPFLVSTAGPIIVGTETFIGDPNILQTVTGSPFGTNFFRVEVDAGGGFTTLGETDQFAISGLIFDGALPSPLNTKRSTYSREANGVGSVDIFAVSAPAAIVFFEGGPNLPAGAHLLAGDSAGNFFAHLDLPNAATLPSSINLTANNPPNAPTIAADTLTDFVSISKAEFNVASNTLTIEASSSDKLANPILEATGIGALAGGVITLATSAPPPKITVVSSVGGSDTKQVSIIAGPPLPPPNTAPTFISTPLTTASVGTPYVYDANANDSPGDTLTFSLVTSPTGMTINPSTGVISWTPSALQGGANAVTVRVTDQGSLFANQSFSITVAPASPETITVSRAEYDISFRRWLIRGNTNLANSLITARLTRTNQIIGSATATSLGSWTIFVSGGAVVPQAGDTITLRSANGAFATVPVNIVP